VWVLIREIFDVFAMHDVTLLLPKIVNWFNRSLATFNRGGVSKRPEELYQDMASGVNLACMLALYVKESSLQPDFRQIYEHPINRQEMI